MEDLHIYQATNRQQIETTCRIGEYNRLHSGVWGHMEGWYKTPEVFDTMTMAVLGQEPIGIAGQLAYQHDDELYTFNTTIFVRPAYRRQGVGKQLIDKLKEISRRRVLGFTGEFYQSKFWVEADADGRKLTLIKQRAEALGTTPRKMGYYHFPKTIQDDQRP